MFDSFEGVGEPDMQCSVERNLQSATRTTGVTVNRYCVALMEILFASVVSWRGVSTTQQFQTRPRGKEPASPSELPFGSAAIVSWYYNGEEGGMNFGGRKAALGGGQARKQRTRALLNKPQERSTC